MRLGSLLTFVSLLVARLAAAACPPDCVGGGGPVATDCIVTWGGIAAASAACVDGDASCDLDGEANGECVFPLQACFGIDGACGGTVVTSAKVTPRKLVDGAVLASAIQNLAPGGCSAPGFRVPVARRGGLGPIKPGVARIRVVVAAGGKKDPDRLTLTCQPPTPSFAGDVQPILTQRCTQGACHDANFRSQGLDLSAGAAHGSLVGVPSTEGGTLLLVAPGNVKKSFMARKITGQGLKPANGAMMPQGCPGFPPAGGCLTDAEVYTILAWIQAGAPNS